MFYVGGASHEKFWFLNRLMGPNISGLSDDDEDIAGEALAKLRWDIVHFAFDWWTWFGAVVAARDITWMGMMGEMKKMTIVIQNPLQPENLPAAPPGYVFKFSRITSGTVRGDCADFILNWIRGNDYDESYPFFDEVDEEMKACGHFPTPIPELDVLCIRSSSVPDDENSDMDRMYLDFVRKRARWADIDLEIRDLEYERRQLRHEMNMFGVTYPPRPYFS